MSFKRKYTKNVNNCQADSTRFPHVKQWVNF